MPAILVITTTPDLKTARSIARALVKKRLAACVSVQAGLVSFYRWKGRLENAREAMLFIKSSKEKFLKIKRQICLVHPYKIPEIIAFPVARGSKEYLSWLMQSVK
ncbi:MAG: divalent-cation tolerance protein CutA [Candidatus Omnitrophica bacterium CG07_land_8_20_14_0_80_50_8]|nr:MAG: divalent-cation tolerance protein CutA [Candidatus Omnitrophica bacterium CG07_land_8_20_14_0_80_50_8]